MNRVVHFEVQVEEPERAIAFYEECFGWKFEKWEGGDAEYWMIMTASEKSEEMGINGGLLKRAAEKPVKASGANAYVCTMQVEDYEATAKKILANGGREVQSKTAIAGMAWQGYFLDTEGNVFGIHQADPHAH